MKNETAYVGGPMTNLPGFNFDSFDSLSAFLRDVQGWVVHNPHEHDQEEFPGIDAAEATKIGDVVGIAVEVGFDFKAAMSWDLARVAESDHMVLLPGWETSTGAKAERFVAEMTGSRIWLAHKSEHRPLGDPAWYITLDPEQKRLTPPSLPEPATMSEVWDANPQLAEQFKQDVESVRRDGERCETWADPERQEFAEKMAEGLRQANQQASLQPTPTPVMPELAPIERAVARMDAPQIGQFQTKDSGARVEFESGMVRDVQEGKPRYDLIPLEPLQRLAELYSRGAVKYGDRNWQKANSQDELDRFHASAFRHFIQYLKGDRDEDHGIAVVWNIFAALWLEARLCEVPSVMENDKR